MTENPYVVVLAGGEGNRLASLTRALYGVDLPKQFATLAGERSLLQTTIERAARLTSFDRISVVVAANREAIAREQIAPYAGVELVIQPRSLDTAPGILLPIARILARTWDAHLVILPSDHYVSNPGPLEDALRMASAARLRGRVAMVGVAPTGPEVEYGWIVPGRRLHHGMYAIRQFHEKPHASVAEALWRSGGLWNTFIQTGPVHAFWDLARRHLPHHAEALERYAIAIGGLDENAALEAAYRTMTPANFSHDVLAHAPELAVLPVTGSGWSDWGSPRRVFESLAGTPCHERLVRRMRGDASIVDR